MLLHGGEMMIVRLWKTKVKAHALSEYEENERTRSTPMFKEQRGCLGVRTRIDDYAADAQAG